MQLLHILRDQEPLCGEWFIGSYDGRVNCFDIYTVKNRMGYEAAMKVLVLPEGKNADDYFKILNIVKELSAKNDCFLRLFGYSCIESENHRLVICTIYEKAEDIKTKFSKTRLISGMITELARELAGVLKECQTYGIYHGAISYSSVYAAQGKYKLGNFGEAKLLKETGLSGEENYCSAPEGKKDIRSDIYSLGLIIYSLYNFGRLPFVPSKEERYLLPENAETEAYKKRMNASEDIFPNPLYADPAVIEIINKCCAFDSEKRYGSAEMLIEALEEMQEKINLNRCIEYPNFSAANETNSREEKDMNEEERLDASESMTEGRTIPLRENREEEDQNIYTRGAQEIYTEAIKNIRNNRHIHVDESVLQDIERTERRIAEKYGVNSKHYLKFIEKVRSFENIKDNVETLKKDNKKRATIIKILVGVAIAAVIAGVILALNTNTFYINQGEYDYIYRRNLFGNVECFKSVPCDGLLKDGNRLYYIKTEDKKIYSTSAKDGKDEELIADDAAAAFKIVDGYIYYINNSDGQRLYRIDTDGKNRESISDEACLSISVDKKNIEFINASDLESPKLYDTKNETIKDEYID